MPFNTESEDTPPVQDNQSAMPTQNNTYYQQSSFDGIDLEGDDCLFGSTAPAGVAMKNVKVKGSRRVDGAHMPDTARQWRRQ
ncbi:hypothetical protein RRF57_008947 [Xylaria bambusicola]|uniref:Uncharacterized protein n=1 Tax=Xylaria bambusicola TaxID=326684 RepID=A0AAN7ZBP6_9PEZI